MKDSDLSVKTMDNNQEINRGYSYPEEESDNRIQTVKDFDPDDQPRERALKHGINVLSTADLWALILRTGLPGKPITDLCRDIMRSCNGSLLNLERLSRREIMKTKGIGVTKALQIEAVMELIRRYSLEHVGKKIKVATPADIYNIIRPEIGNLSHEEIWVIFMNRKNEIIEKRKITSGSAVASVFDLKKIVKEALLCEAQSVAMAHNHPSGSLRPSAQDEQITKSLKGACDLMQINMLDHIIVTPEGYYSFHDEGFI